jgi:tetratricopeptide (TPR) repeat protein
VASPRDSAARLTDRRGVLVTTTSATALEALDRAIHGVVRHRADTGAHVASALAGDPDLVPAHCIVGFGAKLLCRSDLAPVALAAARRARASLERRGGTSREQLLVRALELWCARDPEGAVRALDAAQEVAPLDVLSMKLGHALAFLIGRTDLMRGNLARVLSAWERAGIEDQGPVLGCQAFTLHELGDADCAEAVGRRAVAIDASDPWAVHAVAHTLHSRGRSDAGLAWLDEQTACLDGVNNFGAHLAWHRALFLLSLGRADEALAVHDGRIAQQPPGDYRDLVNSATLLFRFQRAGVSVGDRWERLATIAASRLGDHASPFADTHYVLALAASGRVAEADRFVASMREHGSSVGGLEAKTSLEVALPVARAIASLRSDPGLACELLKKHAGDLARLGGSQAQREIFDLVHDEAIDRRAVGDAAA